MACEAEKYDVLEKIGQGSFGVIRKVRRKNDGLVLCRKEICYTKMSEKERKQLQAELEILRKLNHPNIVRYYEKEHHKESHDLHLYMEYCGNGDLGIMIQDLKDRNLCADEDLVWTILAQLILALYRCHYGEDPPSSDERSIGLAKTAKPLKSKMDDKMILHRDLKPENVFLGESNAVKLGDFGLSKMIASHDFASTYVGTPFYMSPEICAAEKYSLYSDIWSLGCVIYELCAKEPPFNARTHFELITRIKTGKITPLPRTYSRELQDVITACLQVNPNNRPDTATLLNLTRIKMVRKTQEAAQSLQQHIHVKDQALEDLRLARIEIARLETERTAGYDELYKKLHMEWEARAHLEINRRVDVAQKAFDDMLEQRVAEEVEHRMSLLPSSQTSSWTSYENEACVEPPARSSTPTAQPVEEFTTDSLDRIHEDDENFPSDLTSLSLEESPLEKKQQQMLQMNSSKPVKRSQRTPLTRARTIANAEYKDSPMDVQMSDISPIRNLASLSLSPRRTAQQDSGHLRQPALRGANIFDQAGSAKNVLTPTVSAHESLDSSDQVSASRSNTADPFKPSVVTRSGRPGMTRQKTMPAQLHSRMRSTPNAYPSTSDAVPSPLCAISNENRCPISPTRRTSPTKSTSSALSSPSRRAPAAPGQSSPTALGVRRDKQDLLRGMQKTKMQGRTLVELSMAETQNQGHGRRDGRGKDSVDTCSKGHGLLAPVWDPETDDMPSPFLVRTRRMVVGR